MMFPSMSRAYLRVVIRHSSICRTSVFLSITFPLLFQFPIFLLLFLPFFFLCRLLNCPLGGTKLPKALTLEALTTVFVTYDGGGFPVLLQGLVQAPKLTSLKIRITDDSSVIFKRLRATFAALTPLKGLLSELTLLIDISRWLNEVSDLNPAGSCHYSPPPPSLSFSLLPRPPSLIFPLVLFLSLPFADFL